MFNYNTPELKLENEILDLIAEAPYIDNSDTQGLLEVIIKNYLEAKNNDKNKQSR